VRLFVYQTDADGYYTRPRSNPRQARLRGSVTTDARGAYRIDTIHPGSYPDDDVDVDDHVRGVDAAARRVAPRSPSHGVPQLARAPSLPCALAREARSAVSREVSAEQSTDGLRERGTQGRGTRR
jgi:hypothetical protein